MERLISQMLNPNFHVPVVEGLVNERGPTAAVRVVQGRHFVQVAPVPVRLALGLRLRRGQRRRSRQGDEEESHLVTSSHCGNEVAVRFVVQVLDIIMFASSRQSAVIRNSHLVTNLQ